MNLKKSGKETDTLHADGSEKVDPTPHSAVIGYVPGDSIEDRIRRILMHERLARDPDLGLDDDDNFDDAEAMPLYPFEEKHEAVMLAQAELEAAQADLEAAKAEHNAREKKRQDELIRRSKGIRDVEELDSDESGPNFEENRPQPPVGKSKKSKKTPD